VAKYASKGVVFLGVNIGANDSPERARAFMQKTGMSYPVLFDQDSSITRRYRVLGVPTIVVANKSGRVVSQENQVTENLEQELGKLLKH
jgi:peroxiredoxin